MNVQSIHTAPNFVELSPLSFLKYAVMAHPERIAWSYEGRSATYAELAMRCRNLAGLLKAHRVKAGDRVVVLAPNVPAMLELHYGVPMVEAVLTTINTRQDAEHVRFVIKTATPAIVFVDVEYAERLQKVMRATEQNCPVIVISDHSLPKYQYNGENEYEKRLAEAMPISEITLPSSENASIVLNHTSGTTSEPKGVLHSHRAAYLNSIGIALLWNLPAAPRFLWIVPLFHCNGWCMSWAITARGGTHVLLRKFEPQRVAKIIYEENITHFCCAPAIIGMLLEACLPKSKKPKHAVQIATGGASPNSDWVRAISQLGFSVTHLYGLTETLSSSVFRAPREVDESDTNEDNIALLRRQGTAQLMVDEIAVLSTETGERLLSDGKSIGEVCIRSNTVMQGYLDNPQATEEAFADGWFHTGDLGVCHNDGTVEVLDRRKDIIISGGENVSSVEVENVLRLHPAVSDAAVVAVPDLIWGERPFAFVKLANGQSDIASDDLTIWCRDRLAGYKCPDAFIIKAALPYSATGKVVKKELRDIARKLVDENSREID